MIYIKKVLILGAAFLAWGEVYGGSPGTSTSSFKDKISTAEEDVKKSWEDEDRLRRLANQERAKQNQEIQYSSESYQKCDIKNDICYELVDRNNRGSPIVQCNKGVNAGKRFCLSYSESSGKYATDCGAITIGTHHYNLKEAGNRVCWGNWLNN
jgi:hypothetical protein